MEGYCSGNYTFLWLYYHFSFICYLFSIQTRYDFSHPWINPPLTLFLYDKQKTHFPQRAIYSVSLPILSLTHFNSNSCSIKITVLKILSGFYFAIYDYNFIISLKKVKVLVIQSCPTLCDPMDCSLPGFLAHGILQARIWEWVAIPFSRRSSWPRDWTQVFYIAGRFFTIWAIREAQYSVKCWLIS